MLLFGAMKGQGRRTPVEHKGRDIVLREVTSGRQLKAKPPCVLGRGTGADLVLFDPAVSNRHALIGETEGGAWIEDLNSVSSFRWT
jgi:pSer/pThr/pTyr-binding forkhead associated (FHA) protein